MSVQIKINNQTIIADEKDTILTTARKNGIDIPTLCYHKDLTPTGNCRICVVEVNGQQTLPASCVTQVRDGIEIHTESQRVIQSRKHTLEFMLANHPHEIMERDAAGSTEFQDLVEKYHVQPPEWGTKGSDFPIDSDPNPFILVDFNKCILCRRCILACEEIQGRDVWGVAFRGFDEQIVAGTGTNLLDARCESCGQCVAYCPTGALSNKLSYRLAKPEEVKKVTTTCTYCGVGCQLDLNVKEGKVIQVTSNPNAPVNGMALCVKGRYGFDFIHHPDRLLKPKVRKYLIEGNKKPSHVNESEWVEVDWETALEISANKLRSIRDTFGPDSIGVLTSAKCTNEENYLMNKFTRQIIGTNNIDHCARL